MVLTCCSDCFTIPNPYVVHPKRICYISLLPRWNINTLKKPEPLGTPVCLNWFPCSTLQPLDSEDWWETFAIQSHKCNKEVLVLMEEEQDLPVKIPRYRNQEILSKQLWSQWSEIPNFKPCFKPDYVSKGGTILNAPRKIGEAHLLKLVFTDRLVCLRIPRILSLPCACPSLCSALSPTDIPAQEQNHMESTPQGLVIVFLRLDILLKVINSALLKKNK